MFGLIGGDLFYYLLPILSHGRDGAANLFFWRPSLSRERLGTDQLSASLLKGGAMGFASDSLAESRKRSVTDCDAGRTLATSRATNEQRIQQHHHPAPRPRHHPINLFFLSSSSPPRTLARIVCAPRLLFAE
jgi:hypothetical protein